MNKYHTLNGIEIGEYYTDSKDHVVTNSIHTCAFDLESYIYYNGKQIESQDEYIKICKDISKHDFKKPCYTIELLNKFKAKAWCFQVCDPVNGFYMFRNWDQLMIWLEYTKNYLIYNFNASFDYPFIEDILWFHKDYSYKPYKGKTIYKFDINTSPSGHYYAINIYKKRQKYSFHDFANFYRTSIAELAKTFPVKENNELIQKTKMCYFDVKWETLTNDQFLYCRNDTLILMNSIVQADKMFKSQTKECSLLYGKDLVMTIGTIAKKNMLIESYNLPYEKAKTKFDRIHQLNIKEDQFLRKYTFYQGGFCMINTHYHGQLVKGDIIGLDYTSYYPYWLQYVRELNKPSYQWDFDTWQEFQDYKREWNKKHKLDFDDQYITYFIIKRLKMTRKKNKIATFKINGTPQEEIDYSFNGEYFHDTYQIKPIMMFDFELFYGHALNYIIEEFEVLPKSIYTIKLGKYQRFKPFVDKFYSYKQNATTLAAKNTAKAVINSATGKFGEKVINPIFEYKLDEQRGYYRRYKKKDDLGNDMVNSKVDFKRLLDLRQIAFITALGRTQLYKDIDSLCNGDSWNHFLYSDTDSIKLLNPKNIFKTAKINDELGGFKIECQANYARFLKPKTYLLIDQKANKHYLSCKGIKKVDLEFQLFNNGEYKTDMYKVDFNNHLTKEVFKLFNYDKLYFSRYKFRVRGGSILLLALKCLAWVDEEVFDESYRI